MTARQFMRLFHLNAAYYLSKFGEKTRHQAMINFFRDHIEYDEAKAELLAVIALKGNQENRMYYIESVYRRIQQKRHNDFKNQPPSQRILDIMADAGKKARANEKRIG